MLFKKTLKNSVRFLIITFFLIVGCYTSIDANKKNIAKTHYNLGVAEFSNGNKRGALKELLEAIKINPELPEPHNAIGLVYLSLKKHQLAREHYEKAIQLKPNFSDAYNNLGALFLQLGEYEQAIKAFKITLNDILYPTPSLAEGNLGFAYYKNNEVPLGIRHLQNAVASEPKFCRGYEWLMLIGVDTKNSVQVIKNYNRFFEYCWNDKNIRPFISTNYHNQLRYYLALAYVQEGNQKNAQEILKNVRMIKVSLEKNVLSL